MNLPLLYVLLLEKYCHISQIKKKHTKPLTHNKHLSLLYFWFQISAPRNGALFFSFHSKKKPNLIFSNLVQGLVHSTIMKAFGKKRCVFLCVSALNLTALCFYIPWIFQVPMDTYMHLHRYLKLFFLLYIYTEISSSNFKR